MSDVHSIQTHDCLLATASTMATSGASATELLDYVYEHCGDSLHIDRLGWAELNESTHEIAARWTRAGKRTLLRRGFSSSIYGSSLFFVMQQRKPRVMDDLLKYLQARPQSRSTRLIAAEGVRSSITCPLVVDDRELGFLFFSSYKPDSYQASDCPFAMAISNIVALVISRDEPKIKSQPAPPRRCSSPMQVPVGLLAPGMVLHQSLRSEASGLLLAAGHKFTEVSIARLRQIAASSGEGFNRISVLKDNEALNS